MNKKILLIFFLFIFERPLQAQDNEKIRLAGELIKISDVDKRIQSSIKKNIQLFKKASEDKNLTFAQKKSLEQNQKTYEIIVPDLNANITKNVQNMIAQQFTVEELKSLLQLMQDQQVKKFKTIISSSNFNVILDVGTNRAKALVSSAVETPQNK